MSVGNRLVDKLKFTEAFAPAVPTSAAPPYVSLRKANHLTILIQGVNGASGVTPVAVTLNQAQDLAGTGAKALAFTEIFLVADAAAGDTPVDTVVTGNSYTLPSTVSKSFTAVIEVLATDLDVANGFCAVSVGLANGAAQTISATYLLAGERFGGNFATIPSALVL
jgi:hypothetical protein